MPDLKQQIQLNGKYYIGDSVVAQLLTQNAADDQTRAMVLEMGLTSGRIVELNALHQLQNVLQAMVALYAIQDLRAPSIGALLRQHHLHQDAAVLEEAVAAIRDFPWHEVVTFAPMPGRKPDGGFLEVGEFDRTYAWENSVKLLLGSNGKVYAEVVECVTELPDLDDEGRPLNGAKEDNHYFTTEQPPMCPQCGARTEFTAAADKCSGCGAVIQSHICLDCGYKFYVHATDESAEEDAIDVPVTPDQGGA